MDASSDSSEIDWVADLLVGLVFCVGVVLSFLPQHVACLTARSAEGLSLSTINFATISFTARLLATFLEDAQSIFSSKSLLQALALSMPTLQNALCVLPGTPTYTIYYFLWYDKSSHRQEQVLHDEEHGISSMPLNGKTNQQVEGEANNHEDSLIPHTPPNGKINQHEEGENGPANEEEAQRTYISLLQNALPATPIAGKRKELEMLSTAFTFLFVIAATIASTFALVNPQKYHQEGQIQLWGAVGAGMNAILWLPQICTTWKLQSGGVLSLVALAFSAFGDFLQGADWIVLGEPFWVWGSLVADAAMQIILMVMILYFRKRDRDQQDLSPLQTPLLDEDECSSNEYHDCLENLYEDETI